MIGIIFALLIAALGTNINAIAGEVNMYNKTKTYCFGRHVADMPIEAIQKGSDNKYIAARIEIYKIKNGGLDAATKKLQDKYKQGTKPGDQRLVEVRYPDSKDKRMIVSVVRAFGDDIYAIDTFKDISKGYMLTTSKNSFADVYISKMKEQYEMYLNQVRYRSPTEIPIDPGFCFENGFVANDGKNAKPEHSSLSFSLKGHPDVSIVISSDTYFKQEKSLLIRRKESGIEERFPGKIHKIREGKKEVNGMQGEEAITYFPSDDETGVAQNLVWETLGEVGNNLKPSIHLEISTGELVAGETGVSSLSNKEAVALYDTILKSIRIRPSR